MLSTKQKNELKLDYMKNNHVLKQIRMIDWNNPSKQDIDYNSNLQNSINEWKNSLSEEEMNFLASFEKEKKYNHIVFLRRQSKKIKSNFVKINYSGCGWYVFSPTAHKFYNRNDEIKVRGIHELENTLKKYGVWGICGQNVVGF